MMFARFLYGDTHKWFFRTVAAVGVASYVAYVQAGFDARSWWILYLLALGAVALVYWGIYAPAKWAEQDNLFDPAKGHKPLPLLADFTEPLRAECYSQILLDQASEPGHVKSGFVDVFDPEPYQEELYGEEAQRVFFGEAPPSTPDIPREVIVLCEYVRLQGRYQMRGKYQRTRQWRPPGFWLGYAEYQELLQSGDSEYGGLGHFAHTTEEDYAVQLLIRIVRHLDNTTPKWRDTANRWAAKGKLGAD